MEEFYLFELLFLIPSAIGAIDFIILCVLKHKCTEPVLAEITEAKIIRRKVSAKMRYYHDNIMYEFSADRSLFKVLIKGQTAEIMVDPNKPEVYYCPAKLKKHIVNDIFLFSLGIYLITHIKF